MAALQLFPPSVPQLVPFVQCSVVSNMVGSQSSRDLSYLMSPIKHHDGH